MFRLKDFRQAHRIYQAKMAEILGTTQSTVSRMETENIDLSIEQYNKLYDAFGKENVDSYKIDDSKVYIAGNSNAFNGKTTIVNNDLVNIIEKQNDMICDNMKKLAEMNERLLALMERFAMKH